MDEDPGLVANPNMRFVVFILRFSVSVALFNTPQFGNIVAFPLFVPLQILILLDSRATLHKTLFSPPKEYIAALSVVR